MPAPDSQTDPHADLIVVGAGIVGLAHAAQALARGLRVRVLERDGFALGASIRNFGHVCTTAQADRTLDLARTAREEWLRLGPLAGFGVDRCGTVVVARSAAELSVLEEFRESRSPEEVRLLTAAEVQDCVPLPPDDLYGGAHLPQDLRLDPLEALPALASWLRAEGADVRFGESAWRGGDGVVETPHATFTADRVVYALGHDVDRLFPEIAAAAEVRRCRLHMLEVEAPGRSTYRPAVLTGTSMLRYGGLSELPSVAAVREEIGRQTPALLEADVNLMFTQRPDGAVVLGDSHHYARHHAPFQEESVSQLLLDQGARLLGQPLRVRRRWRGIYAHSPRSDFLIAAPTPRTRVVSVTTGVGMTTAHGLARSILDDLC